MRGKFTIYIEEENKKKIKRVAVEKECSASDIMDKLVQEYLDSLKSGKVNDMKKVNTNLINKLLDDLDQDNITLENCKKSILKEFQRVEDEWDNELGNMEALWQGRE